jgi:hypothetical protein
MFRVYYTTYMSGDQSTAFKTFKKMSQALRFLKQVNGKLEIMI